ncbi:carbohydrate ABC transporter permease [Paenibacillus eucommiae]|uniref:ABC-type glycerol-3-phosphate transport system permease component n=1 Tax=Paenibacillus eucommiae TaxID=1355755 RepID=A0ABS4J234_9BACL|nr:carbohydrate ABC transporter permease [Paenibacillus eucommiae]MBP1993909.1 ABC-type glycerol-3-phosphate transport system permease component [Paenibacillus eucommiae]
MQERRTFMDGIWRLLLLLWALSIIFPVVWILYQSLRTNVEFFQDIWALPTELHWSNYTKAWTEYNIGQSLLNTLYYVGVSLVLGTFLTTLNAYALTRMRFRGRKFIWSLIMLSLFLPGINALVPQYILMKTLNLTNSLTGLIILDSFGENVFFLMLLGGFMSSLPKDLEESGFIDGASLFQMFWKIIVPLSTPGIVTVAIFKFLGLYNNFLGPFIYLSEPSKYTIGVNMYQANMKMQYTSDWVTMFAGVIIVMIPSIIFYVIFQKRIMAGATMGAMKG